MDKSGERLDVSGRDGQVRRGVAGANPAPAATASGAAPVGAALIGSHYAGRRWMLTSKAARPFIHLLCLHGAAAAELGHAGKAMTLVGPAMVWIPAGSAEYLEVSAGRPPSCCNCAPACGIATCRRRRRLPISRSKVPAASWRFPSNLIS